MSSYYVYILASKPGTLYTGVTRDIVTKSYQRKHKLSKGFTSKYNINRLVFSQEFNNPNDAIAAEKKIKDEKVIRKSR